ncbi:HAD-IA family hydrolase [Thermodesulfatator atlanticus]|uniref:HAD-IA family hydrolase n=1 Tax=Thermodesulfatator atlanticus TaxID=501497 RepID=UPI0003B66D8E|nr:HAD-IA family hydrolase [Thermodesulfatator atlanticus]
MLPEYLWDTIETVFFDAEGTLLHIYPSVGHIYAEICKSFGIEVEPTELQKAFFKTYLKKRGNWTLSPESCFQGWKEVFFETISQFGSLSDPEKAYHTGYECFAKKDYFLLTPDTRETLKALKASGRKIAVLSNWDERLIRLLKDLGLAEEFDDIIVSCEVGLAKPDPAIYKLACERLATEPSRALMIGDSIDDDVIGARKAGLFALRYPGGSLKKLFPKKLFNF